MKTVAEEVYYGEVNITANMHEEYQVCLWDGETEATTWCIADTDCIVS
jgi:hypothetical protein